jgi:CubicO group peptidase (beta-lactamase class C family)
LVEQNKLSLDIPINALLSENDYRLIGADERYIRDLHQTQEGLYTFIRELQKNDSITIRHLLTHTSGIQDAREKGIHFDPSKFGEHHYSNYGYQLLARIVSQTAKMPFQQYISQSVAMTSARPQHEPTPLQNSTGWMIPLNPNDPQNRAPDPDGNGCWWMTAKQLHQFGAQLLQNELVSKNILNHMLTPLVERRPGEYQGLGFLILDGTPRAFLHSGSMEGRSAQFLVVEGKHPLVMTVLSNTNEGGAVIDGVLNIVVGKKDVPPPLSDIVANQNLYQRLVSATSPERLKQILEESKKPPYIYELMANELEKIDPNKANLIRSFVSNLGN